MKGKLSALPAAPSCALLLLWLLAQQTWTGTVFEVVLKVIDMFVVLAPGLKVAGVGGRGFGNGGSHRSGKGERNRLPPTHIWKVLQGLALHETDCESVDCDKETCPNGGVGYPDALRRRAVAVVGDESGESKGRDDHVPMCNARNISAAGWKHYIAYWMDHPMIAYYSSLRRTRFVQLPSALTTEELRRKTSVFCMLA